MIYFISGHRDITQEEFDANYVPAIEDGKKIADLVKANLCN